MPNTFAIGDIHGHYDRCLDLLHEAGLVNADHHWSGADATLVFIGDYVDRGPDGIAVLDLVTRLQTEAKRAEGQVIALLGNHDLILALAYRFGRGPFHDWWRSAGGIPSDLARMTGSHLHWLLNRPIMLRLGDQLYVHADAEIYYDYGYTVAAVNQTIDQIIRGNNVSKLSTLVDQFGEHRSFYYDNSRAGRLLATYGGSQIIHGHTPIRGMAGDSHEVTTRPYVYADGLCVNLDGGIYAGGEGFVYRVE